jgi:hypothetical protein
MEKRRTARCGICRHRRAGAARSPAEKDRKSDGSVFEIKYAVLLMSFAVAALSCLLRKANEILTVIMAKK